MKAQKHQKELIVIAKYTIKRNGAVVYRVRSSEPNKKGRVECVDQVERNGLYYNAYNVTVYKDETVCGCTCKGSEFKGKCFHRDGIQLLIDNAKAKQSAMSDGLYAKLAAMNEAKPAKVVELRGNLNGAQQSAGLLMELPSRKLAS